MGITSDGESGGSGGKVQWSRRSEVKPFSPAPGIHVQPIVGESMMTCWITMDPGAVVAEHSHPNEQLGVVVEGSVALTADGATREAKTGEAYVVPSGLPHRAVAGASGALLVETFVPVREDYVRAWRAVGGGESS
jgi:quercetin dioxygenase-like cupin family protein